MKLLKNWFINPCKKCLVTACCTSPCDKYKLFISSQTIVWVIIGFLIITIILATITYYTYPLINIEILIVIIVIWITSGNLLYTKILDVGKEKNKTIVIIFSFIWLPYVIMGALIGMGLVIMFTDKRWINHYELKG